MHHHGVGSFCDRFFKTRLKDTYPKAWKKVVLNCYDNGYICTSITNEDLIELIKEREKEIDISDNSDDSDDNKDEYKEQINDKPKKSSNKIKNNSVVTKRKHTKKH